MKCKVCNVEFNDGVQCSGCKNHLDFSCASISESTWRKYGAERKAQWKCSSCRAPPSAISAPAETVSLESIMKELKEMKSQMTTLTGLKEDMRSIKNELSELKDTCVYSSGKLDDLSGRLSGVETRVADLEKLQNCISVLQSDLMQVKIELSAHDQRSRLNNVEIKGVPLKKDENLFSVVEEISRKVNCAIPKTQINYISRVPMHNSKEKLIIMSFINRYVKEEFIAAARTVKKLVACDIGFAGISTRIYVNDHLSIDQKKLLTMTKNTAKDKNFSYVWVKHGKIHVRRNDTSRVIVIKQENDLNKIV